MPHIVTISGNRERVSVTFKETATIVHLDDRTLSRSMQAPPSTRKLPRGRKLELSDVSVEQEARSKKKLQVHISGMSCSSCVAKIERHLAKKKGNETETHTRRLATLVIISLGLSNDTQLVSIVMPRC